MTDPDLISYQDHRMQSLTKSVGRNKRMVFEDSDDEDPVNVKPEETYSCADRQVGKFDKSNRPKTLTSKPFNKKDKHVTFNDESKREDSDSELEDSDSELEDSESDLEVESEAGESSVENSESNDVKDYSDLSMEELLNLQEKMGTRTFREKVLKVQRTSDTKRCKRLNKNRPSEVPLMRKRAPRMNFIEPGKTAKEKIRRDPRFDDLSGSLFMDSWNKNFEFLKATRQNEMEILKKAMKKQRNPKVKETIKKTLQRMQNQAKEGKKQRQEKDVKRLAKQQQREALKKGIKPRFMSDKEKKMQLKTMQFEQLKKDNKLGKYFQRREKKQLKREMTS